ncbi:hypothetical protein [Legionella hackeliae]|nr:hypothetical protein [Legionella hackeliae]
MMLQCLPQNEEGEAMRVELLTQFEEVKSHGVIYRLMGELHRETQYNFSVLHALNNYVAYFEEHGLDIFEQMDKSLVIGYEQKLIPAHIAQHYCELAVPFWPTPSFKHDHLKRMLTVAYSGDWYSTANEETAYHPVTKEKQRYAMSTRFLTLIEAKIDARALEELQKVRLEDLNALHLNLQKPIHCSPHLAG